jgi:predicted DNA-binding transcriptional regulator YafY/predicted transcriptional regulator YdeE
VAEDKPRLTRLAAIVTQLQSKRIVTARDIAQKHKVSIRTVYRDIRAIEQSGVPVVTEEGKGYSIMEGYNLPPVMFTEEEANALITAEHIILKNKDESFGRHYQNAVMKIKAILKPTQIIKTELLSSRIQIRNNPEGEKNSDYLIRLQSTIANFQVVKINYLSLDNVPSEREIEPFALYTTRENWILIAFCRMRNDFRAFRLDCIKQIGITDEHFEPHKITLEQYLEECRKKCQTPDIPLTWEQPTFVSNQNKYDMQKVKIEPFKIIGISVRTSNENNQGAKDIPALWQKFIEERVLYQIPNRIDDTVYCVYTDYESDHTKPYTTVLGCKVESLDTIPEGLTGKSFEGGNYIKITAKGDLAKGLVIDQWSQIWQMELDRSYTTDIEVYEEKRMINPSEAEVDFFIALK